MEKATNLGLPWRLLRPRLAPSADDGPANEVNYLTTLELLDTDTIVSINIYKAIDNIDSAYLLPSIM